MMGNNGMADSMADGITGGQVELIARLVMEAMNQKQDTGKGYMVPVGVAARHVHLTQEHVEILFGEGYHLTKKKELMGGQFASNELVTLSLIHISEPTRP